MKIRTRISLITILILTLAIAATVFVTIYNIKQKAARDIERYRQAEREKVEQSLKNFVNMAYETVEANYRTTSNQAYLEKFYGERLKNMVGVVYDVVASNYRNAQNRAYLEKFYGHRLKNILEVTESILKEKAALVKAGKLTLPQAQQAARTSINNIRYNNSGYIWVNDTQLPYPKMIIHPTIPDLNGQTLNSKKFNCAQGIDKNLFQAAVECCLKKGSGFIVYKWPKPSPTGKMIPDVAKLSYVKLFKPWNWVLGVGIYIDDALKDAQGMSLEEIKSMRYDHGNGYFWVNDTTPPIPKMIMHPEHPELNNSVLDSPAYNSVGPDKANLFQVARSRCAEKGCGFIFYKWPKTLPNGKTGQPQLKLAFVKQFSPWNWIIGTGIYLDDAVHHAQLQAKQELRKLRYDNGEGYFWINDMAAPYPTMLMHSTSPQLEGQRLDAPRYNCAGEKNENLFKLMVDTCRQEGHGFISYSWPKPGPDGTPAKPEPKLSYVRLFKPWNWVIGTGVYIDHINHAIQMEQERIQSHVNMLIYRILLVSAVIAVLAVVLCFIFADTLASPINKLIGTMKEVDLTSLSTTEIAPQGAEELKELGTIFNGMLKSLHDAVEELKETTAVKEKIEGELNVARDIQMSIIPKLFPAFPERPEFDVYATLETAKAVGGDLYDFFFIDNNNLCFIVGDVSGKGVPASLFMAVTRTLIRAKTKRDMPVGTIMTEINDALCIDNEQSMFVTMFFCVLNLSTGELTYCNAGHNPAYITRNQTDIEASTETHGLPLGVMEEIPYNDTTIKLNAGDSILLYTDGVTEAHDRSNNLYEDQRLKEVLEKCKMYSPKATVDLILQEVEEFAKGTEQADDITILALNYRGKLAT